MKKTADGDLRGRRDEADPARSPAVLHQARGDREEPQAERPARSPGLQPGGLIATELSFFLRTAFDDVYTAVSPFDC